MGKFKDSLNEASYKIGDKVRVQKPRTSGAKVHDIVITKILTGGKVEGHILSGDSAGMTVSGKVIKEL